MTTRRNFLYGLGTSLGSVADDLCFFRGCQVDSVNHPTAMFQMNCGNRFGGDPGLGAWVTYELGTENQNLPVFFWSCPRCRILKVERPIWSHAGQRRPRWRCLWT